MCLGLALAGTLLIDVGNAGNGGRGTLNGSALQVVHDATLTTHFFAPTGATWATMNECRHGRAMAGTLFGARCIEHEYAPVHACSTEHDVAGYVVVLSNDRTDERTLAHACERYGIVYSIIRHDSRYRPESLYVVAICFGKGCIVEENDGRQKSTLYLVGAHDVELVYIANDDLL